MAAITVRNLPDDVHDVLRARAARESVSVEGVARRLLAAGARARDGRDGMGVTGMAEVSLPWGPAPEAVAAQSPEALSGPSSGALWGALRGSAFIPQGADLTAPLGEHWDAAG